MCSVRKSPRSGFRIFGGLISINPQIEGSPDTRSTGGSILILIRFLKEPSDAYSLPLPKCLCPRDWCSRALDCVSQVRYIKQIDTKLKTFVFVIHASHATSQPLPRTCHPCANDVQKSTTFPGKTGKPKFEHHIQFSLDHNINVMCSIASCIASFIPSLKDATHHLSINYS